MADVAIITTKWVTVPDANESGVRPRSRHVGPGLPATVTREQADRLIRLGAARRPEAGEPGAPKRTAAKREDT